MGILATYEEVEEFHAELAATYKKWCKFGSRGSGNVKKIFDEYQRELFCFVAGERNPPRDMNIMLEIDLIPVRCGVLNMKLREIMAMTQKQRIEFEKTFKTARDRIQAILQDESVWMESNFAGQTWRYTVIPIDVLP